MGRVTWWLIAIGIAYFLFYLGGSYSFRYTHVCTRSHKQVSYVETQHASKKRTTIVCDRYSSTAKRWSFGDPARAVSSERLTKWDGMGIGLIVVVIGAAIFLERRRRNRQRYEARVMRPSAKS